MRNVVSVIFSLLAGFFMHTADILAFIQDKSLTIKVTLMAIFLFLAGVCLLISLALIKFQHWKRITGIVILGATVMTLFIILTLFCMMMTEALRSLLKPETLDFFSNYLTGMSWNIILALLGGWLCFISYPNTDKTRLK